MSKGSKRRKKTRTRWLSSSFLAACCVSTWSVKQLKTSFCESSVRQELEHDSGETVKASRVTIPSLIAAFQASAVVGPATGFVVNGHFLKYYVDQGVNPELLGLTRDSTAWVGAWWLCFLYAGLMCFAVALPVSFLPAELPDHAVVMAEKKLEDQDKPLSQNEGNLRATVLHLLSIKPFVLVCFAGSAERSVTIPTAMVGVMLGGVVISRFQLAAAGIVRLCVLVLLVPIVLVTVLLFHCDNIPYRNVQYDVGGYQCVERERLSEGVVQQPLRLHHDTLQSHLRPRRLHYYSPCYAGCLREYATASSRVRATFAF
ncbi:hypothetical protein HPB49_025217 [Dermacentor silvarum]|uniref:Uncharacterized protein n=1 Tax=Dermacentor silvarum TaxID=543639 RepID=A0ACB8E4I4_DERSI|nr:hypothetical protein HPB49_025217 [Dermacentor silvarum]